MLVHHTNLSAQLVHRHRYTHNSIHQLAGFYTYAQNRQHVYILTSVALIATTKYNLITRGLYFSNTAISRTATQTYSHTHFLTHPQTVRGTNTYNFFFSLCLYHDRCLFQVVTPLNENHYWLQRLALLKMCFDDIHCIIATRVIQLSLSGKRSPPFVQ